MTKSNPHVVPRGDQWACSEKALTGHPRCTQPKLMPSMLAAVSLKTSVANSSSIGRMVRFVISLGRQLDAMLGDVRFDDSVIEVEVRSGA